jgi:arylsulfatase A-like enzyme
MIMKHCLSICLLGAFVAAARPNVLFLAVDDMKDWTGYQGGYEGKVVTPNIDRLAARGRPFLNAHCPSPKCGPSRAAIMHGKRASTLGIYGNGQWVRPNYPDLISIPGYFKAQGYRTVGAGKIHHHTTGFNPPDQWHDYQEIDWEDPWDRPIRSNYPFVRDIPRPQGHPFSGVAIRHEFDWGSLPEELAYHDVATADYAIEVLNAEQHSPFFLACGLFRPHLPWYAPAEYFEHYPLAELVMPPLQKNDLEDVPKAGRSLTQAREFELIKSKGKYRQAVQAYLASISFADAQLGRVLDALDASPYAKNTIVVLWSDHGWHLGSKNHWHKWTLWEEASRVPFVISVPEQPKAGVPAAAPVNLLDLFPTLASLCGLPPPSGLDGIDLSPLIANPEARRGRPVTIERGKGQSAVRDTRYRYIRYQDASEELYDLERDPQEWTNRADDPELAAIKAQLAAYATRDWKKGIPGKGAFRFDPKAYEWTRKTNGEVIR